MFGWRKASKCKKLIRRALGRLKMLKKKRYSIVRQLREDLAELINNGYQQIAFNRVEQLIKDENLMEAYELIENFCEFILLNLSRIRKHKNSPDDIMEAISSLIFASARCGDFPELKMIRKLFEDRYGRSFAVAAVELCPGNLVSPQIQEKLAMKPVSGDEKQRLINELAIDCFYPAMLALEYCPDWHQKQVLDIGFQSFCGRIEPELQKSDDKELEREMICNDSSSVGTEFSAPSPRRSTSANYLVCQSSPNLLEEVCNNSELASSRVSSWEGKECQSIGCNEAVSLEDKFDRETDGSSSESLPSFSDETIVYLDDIVELQNSTAKARDLQDGRLFKFKNGNAAAKGLMNSQKRHQNRILDEESNSSSSIEEKLSNCCCPSSHSRWLTSVMESCSLKQQLYVYSGSEMHDFEVVISEQKIVNSHLISSPPHNFLESDLSVIDFHHHKDHILGTGDALKEIGIDTIFDTSFEIETMVYDVFIYSHHQPEETNGKPDEFSAMGDYHISLVSYEMEDDSKEHTKAAALPIQRSRDDKKGEISCSYSCPNKYPSHVHPKLPDYEEIAARFMALKRDYLQNKRYQFCNRQLQ